MIKFRAWNWRDSEYINRLKAYYEKWNSGD